MKLLPPARFVQVAAFLTPPVSILAPRSLAVLLPLAALAAGVSALERRTLRMPPAGPTVMAMGIWQAWWMAALWLAAAAMAALGASRRV
jgi:hypothetical protein